MGSTRLASTSDSESRRAPAGNTMSQKFTDFLKSQNLNFDINTFSESTCTSADAAAALNCQLGQIAKSLIFRIKNNTPLLIITSGSNRVDENKIETLIGQQISQADADFVQIHTGYIIGGIPPFGFLQPIKTFIDRDLLQYSVIWSAAGDPHSVFSLSPQNLIHVTRGIIVCVK